MITSEIRMKAIDLYYKECEKLGINPTWSCLNSIKRNEYINRVK